MKNHAVLCDMPVTNFKLFKWTTITIYLMMKTEIKSSEDVSEGLNI